MWFTHGKQVLMCRPTICHKGTPLPGLCLIYRKGLFGNRAPPPPGTRVQNIRLLRYLFGEAVGFSRWLLLSQFLNSIHFIHQPHIANPSPLILHRPPLTSFTLVRIPLQDHYQVPIETIGFSLLRSPARRVVGSFAASPHYSNPGGW